MNASQVGEEEAGPTAAVPAVEGQALVYAQAAGGGERDETAEPAKILDVVIVTYAQEAILLCPLILPHE